MADLDDLFLADPAVLAALDNIEREYSSNNPPGGVSDGAACSHQMPSGGAGRASSCMAGQFPMGPRVLRRELGGEEIEPSLEQTLG